VTRDGLTKMGLVNGHLEPFKFGRGWSSDYVSVRMIAPDTQAALRTSDGVVARDERRVIRGKVVKAKLESKEDLESRRQLAGAIVMIADPKEMKRRRGRARSLRRRELQKLTGTRSRPHAMTRRGEFLKRREFRKQLAQFAMDEKTPRSSRRATAKAACSACRAAARGAMTSRSAFRRSVSRRSTTTGSPA
jgi:hypothetical protein